MAKGDNKKSDEEKAYRLRYYSGMPITVSSAVHVGGVTGSRQSTSAVGGVVETPPTALAPGSETSENTKQNKTRRSGRAGGRSHGPQTTGTGPMNERVKPKPSQFTELTRDRAERLATTRRGWFDEFTWAAIGGFFAALPSAIHSYMEVRARQPLSFSLPQMVDFGVLLIFVVLLIVAFVYGKNRGLNSMQYLEKHYGIDPDAEPVRMRHRWWARFRK